jgi:hypothetical protein
MATFDRGNIFQTELFEKNVLIPYLQDYRNVTNFARFMGGSDAVIYNKMESKGDGDRIVFPLRQTFDPAVAIGNEQLEGNEQELTYVSDMVDVGRIRFATLLTDSQLMSLQTKFNLESDVRADLLSQADMLNTKRILQSFALAFDGGAAGVNPNLNQQFSYADLRARILASRLDRAAGGGISRARILIGDPNLAGGNCRTTYADLVTALAVGNFPVATNVMNVSHIRQLFNQAATGQSLVITDNAFTVKESSIRPYKYKTHLGFEDKRYVLFIAPETYNKLAADAVWQAQVNRGVIENQDQPSILFGSMYKGTIEGVMVIVIPELSNFIITNGAGNSYAYSLFCGAAAVGFGMGQTPTFTFRSSTDYELYKGLAHNEISGLKLLKYPSKARGVKGNNNNLVEYGVVHSFTTIA